MGLKLRSDDDTLEKLMESKLEGFKSSLINELTQNIKIIIADEIKKTLGEYQQKIEQCTSTITMLQNQIISLKEVNQKMRKDNEAQFKKVESLAEENQQYGRRLCLRVKNLEKKSMKHQTVYWILYVFCLKRKKLIFQIIAWIGLTE